jgi:hypothetical protein
MSPWFFASSISTNCLSKSARGFDRNNVFATPTNMRAKKPVKIRRCGCEGQSNRQLRYIANEDGHKVATSECLREERQAPAARGAKQEESKWCGRGVDHGGAISTDKQDSDSCASRADVHDCGWTSYPPSWGFTRRGRPNIQKMIASIQRSGRLRLRKAESFASVPIR